jgi:hypothetical protein
LLFEQRIGRVIGFGDRGSPRLGLDARAGALAATMAGSKRAGSGGMVTCCGPAWVEKTIKL